MNRDSSLHKFQKLILGFLTIFICSWFSIPAQDGWSIAEDEFGALVRIDVEKIKDWGSVPCVRQCIEIPPEQDQDLPQHGVISNMKDIDGDGRQDIFCRLIEKPYSRIARFDDRGKQVWVSERLAPGSGDESGLPMSTWIRMEIMNSSPPNGQ